MNVEELAKVRKAIKQGLKKQFSLSETDLLVPNEKSWDKVKLKFKSTASNLIANLENDAYDDASGEIDKVINMLQSWKNKIDKGINDNNLNETSIMHTPEVIMSHYTGDFSKYIIPGTAKFTYGPDDEGTLDVEVQLAIPRHSAVDLETATLETRKQLAFNNYQGPGQSYAKGTVYAIKQNARDYILGFSIHMGNDI